MISVIENEKNSLLILYIFIIGPCLDKKCNNCPTSLSGSSASTPAAEAGLFCTLLVGCLVAEECLEESELERLSIFTVPVWETLVDGDGVFILNREAGAQGCGAGT